MNWADSVYRYCERGQDPAFWAEPFNALSNVAFLTVAALAWARLGSAGIPAIERRALNVLIALALAVGIGSSLYHTFATRWSRLADVIPISAFMVAYLVLALRLFLGWSAKRIAAVVVVFLGASGIAASISCPSQLTAITTFAREPCLKGTMGYIPALIALLLTGAVLRARHPAGPALLAAAGVFLAAMIVRWMDARSCPWTMVLGSPRGTHALWHLLVAWTVHILLRAAIDAAKISQRSQSVAVTPPST